MNKPIKILIVDDVSANLNLLTELLEPAGFEVLAAPSGAIALSILEAVSVDLILLDILMPDMDGIETCRRIKIALQEPPPILFISGGSLQSQLEQAFAAGAVDYISKPFLNVEVLARVNNQLHLAQLQSDLKKRNRQLQEQISRREQAEEALTLANETLSFISSQEAQQWGLSAFIGSSEPIRKLSQQIRQLQCFASTNVMVLGESGSGKELVARALHFGSDNKDQPFIAINCSAISEQLAEAEFFGAVKGAYTGANTDRKGFFEMADGGTLFLDEVGDLPLPMQAKLLRTLEDGSFYPVGGNQLKTSKVRIVAATNFDLDAKIKQKEFREDLYFRIAQFTLVAPPLRERRDDVPQLAHYFINNFAREMKLAAPVLSDGALVKLQRYEFPGNVRELRNIIERAIILGAGPVIEDHQIQVAESALSNSGLTLAKDDLSIKSVKRQLAEIALEQSAGNVTAAAKLLGVHRSWFYRLQE